MAEDFSELLWDLDTLGTQEEVSNTQLVITAFFADSYSIPVLDKRIREAIRERGLKTQSVSLDSFRQQPQEWIEKCRHHFQPFSIGSTFYIHAPWSRPSERFPVNLLLEPGQAFGTGTHESTRLCLCALAEMVNSVRTLLDVGTGSGILAMAARKLNPDLRIVALDNDSVAVTCAAENFRRNRAREIDLLVGGPESVRSSFELVVANLTLAIFREQARYLEALTKSTLILSGFTAEQEPFVQELFPQMKVGQRRCENNWVCLQLTRQSNPLYTE